MPLERWRESQLQGWRRVFESCCGEAADVVEVQKNTRA